MTDNTDRPGIDLMGIAFFFLLLLTFYL